MKLSKSKEWLERVLQTDHLDEPEFMELLKDCRDERQHLDFKSGLEFTKQDPAATLRDYAAAFGNSDGGIIIFGYDEKQGAVDGVGPIGKGKTSPHDWATRTLSSLAPYFSPPPRIIEAEVGGKTILAVAVARAPRLVPLVEKGEVIYRIRLGDSNVTAPPWLMSDLILGRRNAPQLELRDGKAEFRGAPQDLVVNVRAGTVAIHLEIENAGLLHAEDVRIGLVGWITPPQKNHRAAPPSLLTYIEDRGWETYEAQTDQPPWFLAHIGASSYGFEQRTFERTNVDIFVPVPLFPNTWEGTLPPRPADGNELVKHQWDAQSRQAAIRRARIRHDWALYILSLNAEPWFYQVRATYEGQGASLRAFQIAAPEGTRPVIGARFVGLDEEP